MKFKIVLSAIFLLCFFCSFGAEIIKTVQKNANGTIISEKEFNLLFPLRNKFYTYKAFVSAINEMARVKVKIVKRGGFVYQFTRTLKNTGKSTIVRQDDDWDEDWAKKKPDSTYTIDYGNFCTQGGAQERKKELAAFLAHIAHETRHGEDGKYNDGLMFVHEINISVAYVAPNDAYPAVSGKKYYGRGPIQISYNGNYGYASDCIFGDKNVLLKNPDLVEKDPVTAFKTAIYFWMTPQVLKPSAHDVILGIWKPNAADKAANRVPGFGMTINIVNGPIECGKGENMYNMNDRIGFYQYFLKKLGASDTNCACSCGGMKAY